MAKRKAAESGHHGAATAIRQSSRRRISARENHAANETSTTKPDIAEEKTPLRASKAKKSKTSSVKKDTATSPKLTQSQNEDSKPSNADGLSSQRYWLMKAEPESRLENGHDVKFSIDDLASKTTPEQWDGIRAYPARNNLRSMKKGDLAFFYHSNCKAPAIVGIMEIVKEHSPDFSAQNPKAAYYDPKDTDPENPKWSVVHVEFRRKFKEPITLKELREHGAKGEALEDMQMLKQSRLSVSAVTKDQWDFLINVVEEREKSK